ncbi:MAG: hypothetical protein CM1200mP12_02860 [Gammaproteobacteria bacterium]|nr:MAG: hypothetical protein CM1200mP12_02860 [Gammaproteobacteria bacterium]
MVEVMCGKGALLSQLIASIRPKGAPEKGFMPIKIGHLHPFQYTTRYLLFVGLVMNIRKRVVVLRLYQNPILKRRHPFSRRDSSTERSHSSRVPPQVLLSCGTVQFGPSNYPRNIKGERVGDTYNFSRLALRTVEC